MSAAATISAAAKNCSFMAPRYLESGTSSMGIK
jgi:hypothetical protein